MYRLLALLGIVALSACSHQVDSVNFNFEDDGAIRFAATGSRSAPAGSPDNPNSFDTNSINNAIKRFRDCGVNVTRRDADGRTYLDISKTYYSPIVMGQAAQCAELPFRTAVTEYEIEEGLFQTTFITNVRIVRPTYKYDPVVSNVIAASINDIPLRLTFRVPGTIDEIYPNYQVPGVDSEVFTSGDGEVVVLLARSQTSGNARHATAEQLSGAVRSGVRTADSVEDRELDVMNITITSKQIAIQPVAWLIPLAFLLGIGGAVLFMRRSRKS